MIILHFHSYLWLYQFIGRLQTINQSTNQDLFKEEALKLINLRHFDRLPFTLRTSQDVNMLKEVLDIKSS